MNNPGLRHKLHGAFGLVAAFLFLISVPGSGISLAFGLEKQRDPVTLRVITVNPSATKTQETPVRIDLPKEVTSKDVLDAGELAVEYDDNKQSYYVFKDKVRLAPKEVRVFEVTVRDLWFVPQEKLDSLMNYTKLVQGRLSKTEYANSANQIANSIFQRLDTIQKTQEDEALSRKTRIGNFRYHTAALQDIKDDLARMEKLLTFTGGPPVPQMLEESKLKSDAPSRTTTWAVIFLILIFLGLLGGQFFFTWQKKAKMAQDVIAIREAAFSILQKPKEAKPSTTHVLGDTKQAQPRPGSSVGTQGPGFGPRSDP